MYNLISIQLIFDSLDAHDGGYLHKLDRVKKVCLWSAGFDQVRVEKAYTAILLGSSTFTKRIGAFLPSLNLGRAGGRKNMKRRGFPLQRNESNCMFWREIASLTFSIFDEYLALLFVVYNTCA